MTLTTKRYLNGLDFENIMAQVELAGVQYDITAKISEALKGIPKPYLKGRRPWNYGIGDWKGTKNEYKRLHTWVYSKKGKQKRCMNCHTTEKLEWANKSGKYLRDLSDWIRLCVSCHKIYDRK